MHLLSTSIVKAQMFFSQIQADNLGLMIPTKSDLVTGFANVVSIKKNGSLYQMTSSCC